MRVFIYACENTYHGLHGVCDMRVVEVKSIDEAIEYGIEMSEDIIESYDTLSDIDEYCDEESREEAHAEALLEAREWYVYPINEEKAKGLSTEELDKLAADWGDEIFIKEYCDKMAE